MSTNTQPRQPSGTPAGGQFAGKANPEPDVELEDEPNWGVCRSKVGGASPWGTIDSIDHLAPGIISVSTPSHGGIHLSKERNAAVDAAFRTEDGWYEEDCEWAAVAFTFPEAFPDYDPEDVRRILVNWFPDQYEQATGEVVGPGDSYIRDEQLFYEAHKNDVIGVSAIMSRTNPGMVQVTAVRGGREADDQSDKAHYLVPKDVYDSRNPYGFVVDESDRCAPCFLDDRRPHFPDDWVPGQHYDLVLAGTGEKVHGAGSHSDPSRFVLPGEMVDIHDSLGDTGPVRFLGVNERGDVLYVAPSGGRRAIPYQVFHGLDPVPSTS